MTGLNINNQVYSRGAVLPQGLNKEINGELAVLQLLNKVETFLSGNADAGNVVVRHATESGTERTRNAVVHNGTSGLGFAGIRGLLVKGAFTALNENDVALRLGWEVTLHRP